jgi:hypothetical protein
VAFQFAICREKVNAFGDDPDAGYSPRELRPRSDLAAFSRSRAMTSGSTFPVQRPGKRPEPFGSD